MANEALITSRDPKGRRLAELFDVAVNQAKLTEAEAQQIVEQGGELQQQLLSIIALLRSGKPPAKSKRIQFEFSPDAVERMEKLKQLTDATSYAEIVRNSIRVYEWFTQLDKDGFEIGVVKDDQLVKTVQFMF